MIIGILAFVVFIVTTALYTVLGNMYHMRTENAEDYLKVVNNLL